MYLNAHGINVKFLDDSDYIEVHHCLDNRMKELSHAGNVAKCKKADVITLADENMMWAKNILGTSNPKQLVHTLLYMFGIHFALQASLEHRSLCIDPDS